MIAVLDASVFVSAVLKPDSIPERAFDRALAGPDQLILSDQVEAEYREVIFRPKFDRFRTTGRRERFLALVTTAARRIQPRSLVSDCSDPKDNKYLELALDGRAAVIVSGDLTHLLPMHPWRGISILNPTDYLALPDSALKRNQ